MPFVDNPGISIVAFDPGGTVGVAIWDAFEQRVYIDQIDAGRGRKVRLHVFPNKVESPRRARVVKEGTKKGDFDLIAGIEKEYEIIHRIEAGVTQIMLDITMAVGPRAIICFEDWILGWGDSGKVRSSKREGVSPVRLCSRYRQKIEDAGVLNGDAWRNWDGFGMHGEDARGVKLARGSGAPMDLKQRLTDVEMWRLGAARPAEDVAMWAGTGAKYTQPSPASRLFLPGGEKAMIEFLRERGQWRASAPHAMDALMHVHAMARRLGCNVHGELNRIWHSTDHLKGNRVSTKAAFPTPAPPLV